MPELDERHNSLYHIVPLTYGGDRAAAGPEPMLLVPVNVEAACQPVTPGFPPIMHHPLPSPDVLRLVVPQSIPGTSPSPLIIPGDRVEFPVARPPGFRPLVPVPPDIIEGEPQVPVALLPKASPASPSPAHRPDLAAAPSVITRPAVLEGFDPLYGLLLYLALSVGTMLFLDLEARYTVLWTALLVLGATLALLDTEARSSRITSANLTWGFGMGLVMGLPLFILTGPGLAATADLLFPDISPAALFQLLTFVGPMSETLFFRGALQDRRGIAVSVAGAGISSILLYWPAASGALVYLVALAVFYTVLAGVFSFVRTRYGLVAAYTCQVTTNLMLLFLPALLM